MCMYVHISVVVQAWNYLLKYFYYSYINFIVFFSFSDVESEESELKAENGLEDPPPSTGDKISLISAFFSSINYID